MVVADRLITVLSEGRQLRSYSRRERRQIRRTWRYGGHDGVVALAQHLRALGDRAPFRTIADAARVSMLDVYREVHSREVDPLRELSGRPGYVRL